MFVVTFAFGLNRLHHYNDSLLPLQFCMATTIKLMKYLSTSQKPFMQLFVFWVLHPTDKRDSARSSSPGLGHYGFHNEAFKAVTQVSLC